MKVMPSAANLLAAIALALVAFYVSQLIPPLMPESTDFGYFTYVNIAIGLAVGWYTVGRRAGRGWVSAINVGLTGAAMLTFWALFVQSTNEMTRLAMARRYDSAFEALVAIFEIGAGWGILIATGPVLGSLAVGGIITGLVAEFAARRWN